MVRRRREVEIEGVRWKETEHGSREGVRGKTEHWVVRKRKGSRAGVRWKETEH